MAKRLNKTDIIRGRIVDQIAELFGNSVLGTYDNKLRIEIFDEETEQTIQFSIAPVINKVLVSEDECEAYVSTDERIQEYQSSLKKNEEKKPKKEKAPKASKKAKEEVVSKAEEITQGEFSFDETPVTKNSFEDEMDKVEAIMAELQL